MECWQNPNLIQRDTLFQSPECKEKQEHANLECRFAKCVKKINFGGRQHISAKDPWLKFSSKSLPAEKKLVIFFKVYLCGYGSFKAGQGPIFLP